MKNKIEHNLWWWRKKYRRERKVRKQEKAVLTASIKKLLFEKQDLENRLKILERNVALYSDIHTLLKDIKDEGIEVQLNKFHAHANTVSWNDSWYVIDEFYGTAYIEVRLRYNR